MVRERVFIQNKDVYRTPQFPNTTQHQSRQPSTSYFWSHLMLNSPGDHSLLCQLWSHVHFFPPQLSLNNLFLVPFTSSLLDLVSNWFTLLAVIPQLNNIVMWLPVSSLLLTSPGYLTISFQQTLLAHFSTKIIYQLCFSVSLLFSDI